VFDWNAVQTITSLTQLIVVPAAAAWLRQTAQREAKEVVKEAEARQVLVFEATLAKFKIELIRDFNGKYFTTRESANFQKELDAHSERLNVYSERLHAVGTGHDHSELERRVAKLELDMSHVSAGLARRAAGQP
jgi:recombinational DNA repair protein RecR